jgi:hypothetical protein
MNCTTEYKVVLIGRGHFVFGRHEFTYKTHQLILVKLYDHEDILVIEEDNAV